MQQESNNNACKTPNLAVCILLTLTKWECIWDTQNTQVNRIQRSKQGNHQEQLEDQWGHMHECNKNRNMQLTLNLRWDTRLKQEIFLDFMILQIFFFVFFEN